MAAIPSYCPHCGAVFTIENFAVVESGGQIHISDITVDCPVCGEKAAMLEGGFTDHGSGLEVLWGPPQTHSVIQRIREIGERAKSGDISPEQALEEVEKLAPRLARIFRFFNENGVPVLSFVVSLIALYVAYADSDSSDKFETEALKLMSRQVQLMQSLQDRKPVVDDKGVQNERAQPTEKKAVPKSVVKKKKSNRRKDVRKARRKELIERRKSHNPRSKDRHN